jgi:PKD repeat protein
MDNVNTRKFVYVRKLIFHFPELPYLLLVASCLLFFAESCLAKSTAVINVGSHQNVGYTVCFDGSQSYGDNHDIHQIAYYNWNFGDGSGEDGEYLNTHTHVYDNPGAYTVTLTVTDYSGETSTTSTSVTVGTLPKATVLGNTGSAISFAISSLNGQPGIVHLPAGSYSITSQITIPEGVIIEGAGASNTILTNNYSGYGIKIGGNNVRITGIQLKGDDSNYGIVAYKKNLYVDHCELHDFLYANGITDTGSATFEYNSIYSCNTGDGYGIMVVKDAYSMIRYNEFSNNRHSVTSSGDNYNVMNTGYDFLNNHIEYDNEVQYMAAPIDTHAGAHGRIRVCDNLIENIRCGVSFRDGWGEVRRNTFRNITPGYILRLSKPYSVHQGHPLIGDGVFNLHFDHNTIINSSNVYWLQWGYNCYIMLQN